MMQKHRQSKLCTFTQCYPNQTYIQEEDIQIKWNKRQSKGDKISLKKVQSKSTLINTLTNQSNPAQNQRQISTPSFAQPTNYNVMSPKVAITPVSPRPKITFAWRSDLERTKKAQNKEETPQKVNTVDSQLQKTKPLHKILNSAYNLNLNAYKASLISIPDDQVKLSPKVQESLIVVNYFNPTNQQRKTLQNFLEYKQIQDQN